MTLYSWGFDCGISFPLGWLEYMSVVRKNCDKIEKRLCVNGFKVNVSRHTLFDIRYFLVENPNADVSLNQSDIVDALDIPNDWVCLYKMNGLKEVYAIKEKELVDKYGDCDGELVFEENFDLENYLSTHTKNELLRKMEKMFDVKFKWKDVRNNWIAFQVCREKPSFRIQLISEKLDIDGDEIGAFEKDGEWIYTINLSDYIC